MRAEFARFALLLRRVGVLFPFRDVPGQRVADAIDPGQLRGARQEDLFGRTECLEQAAHAHRSHLRDHVEGDAGLAVVHGGAMLNMDVKGRPSDFGFAWACLADSAQI
jgi:hypothetical protein